MAHRDITPKNIILNAAPGQVRLIDFGIAWYSTWIAATAAPEHVGGNAGLYRTGTDRAHEPGIDYRADLYSLGVVLSSSRPATCRSDRPIPLGDSCASGESATAAGVLEAELPRVISAIMMRLLEKNAEDRYKGAHGILRSRALRVRGAGEGGARISH